MISTGLAQLRPNWKKEEKKTPSQFLSLPGRKKKEKNPLSKSASALKTREKKKEGERRPNLAWCRYPEKGSHDSIHSGGGGQKDPPPGSCGKKEKGRGFSRFRSDNGKRKRSIGLTLGVLRGRGSAIATRKKGKGGQVTSISRHS